jgi:hypothetical protein
MGLGKKALGTLGGLALLVSGAVKGNGVEINGDYNHLIPDTRSYLSKKISSADMDDDIPGKETNMVKYKLKGNKVAAELSYNGKTYAYMVADGNQKWGYVIRDSDGDKVFDELYGFDELMSLPFWTK